jgi:hypothetical protein
MAYPFIVAILFWRKGDKGTKEIQKGHKWKEDNTANKLMEWERTKGDRNYPPLNCKEFFIPVGLRCKLICDVSLRL